MKKKSFLLKLWKSLASKQFVSFFFIGILSFKIYDKNKWYRQNRSKYLEPIAMTQPAYLLFSCEATYIQLLELWNLAVTCRVNIKILDFLRVFFSFYISIFLKKGGSMESFSQNHFVSLQCFSENFILWPRGSYNIRTFKLKSTILDFGYEGNIFSIFRFWPIFLLIKRFWTFLNKS